MCTELQYAGNLPQQFNYVAGRLSMFILQGSLNLLVNEVIKAQHINLLCDG